MLRPGVVENTTLRAVKNATFEKEQNKWSLVVVKHKTVIKHGSTYPTATPDLYKFLKLYIKHIRPTLIRDEVKADEDRALFISYTGKPYSSSEAGKRMQAYAKKCGVQSNFCANNLRKFSSSKVALEGSSTDRRKHAMLLEHNQQTEERNYVRLAKRKLQAEAAGETQKRIGLQAILNPSEGKGKDKTDEKEETVTECKEGTDHSSGEVGGDKMVMKCSGDVADEQVGSDKSGRVVSDGEVVVKLGKAGEQGDEASDKSGRVVSDDQVLKKYGQSGHDEQGDGAYDTSNGIVHDDEVLKTSAGDHEKEDKTEEEKEQDIEETFKGDIISNGEEGMERVSKNASVSPGGRPSKLSKQQLIDIKSSFASFIDMTAVPTKHEVGAIAKTVPSLQQLDYLVIKQRVAYDIQIIKKQMVIPTEKISSDEQTSQWLSAHTDGDNDEESKKSVSQCSSRRLWDEEHTLAICKYFGNMLSCPNRPRRSEVKNLFMSATAPPTIKRIWRIEDNKKWQLKCVEKVRTEWTRLRRK